MIARLAPAALRARLVAKDGELALLDVREEGAFARGHILLASNAPGSRLEIEVRFVQHRRWSGLLNHRSLSARGQADVRLPGMVRVPG